jgi:hypothetical protein
METKVCSKCGEEKPVSEFFKNKQSKSGLYPSCKKCKMSTTKKWKNSNRDHVNSWNKDWSDKNRDKVRECNRRWYKANSEKVIERTEKYRKAHPEISRKSVRKWYRKNKEHVSEYNLEYGRKNNWKHQKGWVKNNPEKIKKIRSEYRKKKILDPHFRLSHRMRGAVRKSLKGNKDCQTMKMLDFTIAELREHLESQFKIGMSWDNYGIDGWHIDHKIPQSVFNFKTPDDIDFKKCWALSNLQPMWAKENLKKGAKLEKPFQPSLAFGGAL